MRLRTFSTNAARAPWLTRMMAAMIPGAAPRYIQHTTGYKATRVKACINSLDGEHTGVRAGRVLRHGR